MSDKRHGRTNAPPRSRAWPPAQGRKGHPENKGRILGRIKSAGQGHDACIVPLRIGPAPRTSRKCKKIAVLRRGFAAPKCRSTSLTAERKDPCNFYTLLQAVGRKFPGSGLWPSSSAPSFRAWPADRRRETQSRGQSCNMKQNQRFECYHIHPTDSAPPRFGVRDLPGKAGARG